MTTARLLDGTAVAQAIRDEVRLAAAAFTARAGRPPGLGIVLVGDDPASEIYVRSKLKSAGESGLRADLERLPATASLDDLLALVERLNRSDVHDGILVQSPLPAAMGPDAERRVFDAISPDKDVDGFHPVNVGRLVQNRGGLVGLHAVRRHRAARPLEHPDRRTARRRHRPQRHRRQADGAAAAARARHGHDLSLADERSAGRRARRPTSWWPRSAGPAFVTAGLRQAGRDGRRRRHHARGRSSADRAAVSGRVEAARGVRAPRLARARRRPSRASRRSPAR